MRSQLSFHPEWEVPSLPEAECKVVKSLLDQKFYYLARGAQAYVFASEDGRFVIKFFQHYRMRPPPWTHLCPSWFLSSLSHEKIKRREALLQADFESYKIAYENLKKETGIVFLHLNKTRNLNQSLTLIDRLGIAHKIDLDQTEFLIQKRAVLAFETLNHLMQKGEVIAAKKAVSALFDLMLIRCKKGIFDKDPDFATNFGFFEGEPMQIDVGRFRLDPSRASSEVYKIDLIHAFDPFSQWLQSHYPILAEQIKEKHEAL